jgi:hypothetical protein
MRLVGSSNPGDVGRDTAVHLLAERAVLTRSICHELTDVIGPLVDRRQCVALALQLEWIGKNLPESFQFRAAAGNLCQREPRPSDGIDLMVVPAGCEDLLQEIRDGAHVGDALARLLTADSALESRADEAVLRERLADYWTKHAKAVRAPLPIECWSGIPPRSADTGGAPGSTGK